MFDMWSSVTSKLEAQTQIQTNIQQTTLQNSSSGSIKGKRATRLSRIINYWEETRYSNCKCSLQAKWIVKAFAVGFVQSVKQD